MLDDIEFFGNYVPLDCRWDRDQNAPLLNIVFMPGTFGNFLKFFLERFSKKTSILNDVPFTDIGTSHSITEDQYSGLIQRYHHHFINDNKGKKGLPVCLILATTEKTFLYLEKARMSRVGDRKISSKSLYQKKIIDIKDTRLDGWVDKICSLYNIIDTETIIPKFIVRDWFKLEFLKVKEERYYYKVFQTFKNHSFFKEQNTKTFWAESLFDWNAFLKSVKDLDNSFNLELDFDKESEMKEVFDKGYELDNFRKNTSLTFEIIKNLSDSNSQNLDISDLDVIDEAFIYAHMEKTNSIQMPLVNSFFNSTEEIKEFGKFGKFGNFDYHYI